MSHKTACLIFAAAIFLAILTPAMADGFLEAGDFYKQENTLIVRMGADGVIRSMQETFYPGEGIMHQYDLEVAEKPADIHGIGVATSDSIIQTGPSSYSVTCRTSFPALVTFEPGALILVLGEETYRITKPRDYLIEIWPNGPDGKPDTSRRLAYNLTKNLSYGFLGIIDKGYVPRCSSGRLGKKIDSEAVFYPRVFAFDGKTLDVETFELDKEEGLRFLYKYSFDLSKDKEINRRNFLILLTQRQGFTTEHPLINPLLLAIYFFEAMMP